MSTCFWTRSAPVLAAGLIIHAVSAQYATGQNNPIPLEIADLIVTAHQFSDEFRYARPPDPELGALVQPVVMHRGDGNEPVVPQFTFNGRTAAEWHADGAWNWYALPENLGTDEAPFELAPGAWDVFTFNAGRAAWGLGNEIDLQITDKRTGNSKNITITLTEEPLRLRSVTCLAPHQDGIIPERIIIHVTNDRDEALTLREAAVYDSQRLDSRRTAEFSTRPMNNTVNPGEPMVVIADTGPLPLRHGLVELVFEDAHETRISRFARLRFKSDRFDIGAGWLGTPLETGVVPLTRERFLQTLARMHVNLFWGEHVPGYTDDTGPDGLYTRYPMRQMGYFEDIERYNSDAWVARIHGVDRLGEPQHVGQPPMDVYDVLKKYDAARYPTTLTLSDEKDWRHYAGIVDYPHYDAYRVSAPAMDNWRLYDCWDRTIFWGAPLEGIGVMTRSLRELSEPLPIALWSQNVGPGWQGQFTRLRRSPTPDEILVQAYQGLANGIISLYWYSLETWSLVNYRDAIDITTRIGREIRLLEDLYLSGHASHHARIMGEKRPSLEFNVIHAPDAALLFIHDLAYYPDHEARVFAFHGLRDVEGAFPLPRWLRDPTDVFRVDADGIYDVDWERTDGGVSLRDTIDRVGVYIVATSPDERAARQEKLAGLQARESAIGFDPAHDDEDYLELVRALGFEDISDLDGFH